MDMRRQVNIIEVNRQERRQKTGGRQKIKLTFQAVLTVGLLAVLGKLVWDSGLLERFFHDTKQEQALCVMEKNPELEEFVKGYPASDGSVTGGLDKEELEENFPLLLQYDSRWGYAPYGDNNIALSGCAPTCLSMVIVSLTGNEKATPDAVADYAMKNGYYHDGVGTMWSLMTEGGPDFGVSGKETALDENVIFSKLEAGIPIICSMRPGDFTATGHFIVLTGLEDDKIRVNDPYSKERSGKLWDYGTLQYQIKNLWTFEIIPR